MSIFFLSYLGWWGWQYKLVWTYLLYQWSITGHVSLWLLPLISIWSVPFPASSYLMRRPIWGKNYLQKFYFIFVTNYQISSISRSISSSMNLWMIIRIKKQETKSCVWLFGNSYIFVNNNNKIELIFLLFTYYLWIDRVKFWHASDDLNIPCHNCNLE